MFLKNEFEKQDQYLEDIIIIYPPPTMQKANSLKKEVNDFKWGIKVTKENLEQKINHVEWKNFKIEEEWRKIYDYEGSIELNSELHRAVLLFGVC